MVEERFNPLHMGSLDFGQVYAPVLLQGGANPKISGENWYLWKKMDKYVYILVLSTMEIIKTAE